MAELYNVTDRRREFPIQVVRPDEFNLKLIGSISPETVRDDPTYTLFCFDFEAQQALFVRTPDDADIFSAPFLYIAQHTHACQVAKMSLAEFFEVGETIEWQGKSLFVHSVGRCGSTLLSKALALVPGCLSLSEPDEFTQVSFQQSKLSPNTVAMLCRGAIQWRCKDPRFSRVAMKTRSEVMVLAPYLCAADPEARHMFLYRDAVSWATSVFRTWKGDRPFDDIELNREIQANWARTIPLVAQLAKEPPFNPLEIRILTWVQVMEGYLGLLEGGTDLVAARYQDLVADPVKILGELFQHVGLPPVEPKALKGVLEKDSQAGSFFDREELKARGRVITEELEEGVKALVATRPRLGSWDVVVPRTVTLN